MPIKRYGATWPVEQTNEYNADLTIELACIKFKRGPEKGGLGLYGHLRNASAIFWPSKKDKLTGKVKESVVVDNPWKQWAFKAFSENSVTCLTGAASCGKTHTAGHYAMTYWAADPLNTCVILTSTTQKMVRKRIWPVIQELFHATNFPGNLVDSKTTLQATKGDDKHGIFAIAVADGNTSKAVANIQGIHAKRMLLIIDEATDTPEAVFQVIPNLRKGCDDFRVIIIGNALSRLDPHGRACEPKNGWDSITVDDEDWETKGVPEWELDPGVCLHFDGTKSPNVKLGQDKWPFLYTIKDLESARKADEKVGGDSLGFWKYTRGFWSPDGATRAILSESMIRKHEATGRFIFVSHTTKISGLDPAYGGDKCVQRFAEFGDLPNGKIGIQLTRKVIIPVKVSSPDPIHYQIAKRVAQECESEGVKPEHFDMDTTGEGGGTADIIDVEWASKSNKKINRTEFGGAPSDMPVSSEDERLSKDAYDRKVTELWFSIRNLVVSGQLRGLDLDDVIQLTKREFTDTTRKVKLDTKAEMKEKIGRSPDDADTIAVIVNLARKLGIVAGLKKETKARSGIPDFVKRANAVYKNVTYSEAA